MKLILREDVKNLGLTGEIVSVSDGYARNFLIPKELAVEANTKNIKEFEHHKAVIMKKAAKNRETMNATADELSKVSLTIKAKAGEEDKLFGAVTSKDVAEALKEAGFDIDKKKIVVDDPIKRLGTYSVPVKVHTDITAQITVNVVQE